MRKTRGGWGETAATAPFPKSRASYFRFARFNTSALYYLRAWHRLALYEQSASHSFRASPKMSRSPRLAHKAPVIQARIRLTVNVWTVLLLPLCDQARPWFRFSKRTSSVAGLALCLVAFSRACLVVLFCGENGTAVLSTEL